MPSKKKRKMMTTRQLGITAVQRSALGVVLAQLEAATAPTVVIKHGKKCWRFGMDTWGSAYCSTVDEGQDPKCRTAACIGGSVDLILSHSPIRDCMRPVVVTANELERAGAPGLYHLFFPPGIDDFRVITPRQAAGALRSYLETGEPRWEDHVGQG